MLRSLLAFSAARLGCQPRHSPCRAAARQVVSGLQIDPELRCGVQSLGEQPGSFWGNPSLSAPNLVDPLGWNADVPGKSHLGDSHGAQEFLSQDLPWMSR